MNTCMPPTLEASLRVCQFVCLPGKDRQSTRRIERVNDVNERGVYKNMKRQRRRRRR